VVPENEKPTNAPIIINMKPANDEKSIIIPAMNTIIP
jgi:hypothetical protein